MFWFFNKKKIKLKHIDKSKMLDIDDKILDHLEYINIAEERINSIKKIGVDENDIKEISTIIVWLKNIKKEYITQINNIKKLIAEYNQSNIEFKKEYVWNLEYKKEILEMTVNDFNININTMKQQLETIAKNQR